MPWVKGSAATQVLNVHANTLRRWADTGVIKSIRTPGRMRLYDVESLSGDVAASRQAPENDRRAAGAVKIAYCRVSSAKQKDDLQRQITFMQEKCPEYEIVTDIGSGINFKRKGLRSILERALNGELQEVCVSHRDRLCRFGFELIKWLLERQRVKLVVLSNENTSPQQEFTEDLLAIVHVFSCRFNGLRRYAKATKEAVEEGKAQDLQAEVGAGGAAHTEDSDATVEAAEEDDLQLDGSGALHLQQMPGGNQKRKLPYEPGLATGPVRDGKRAKATDIRNEANKAGRNPRATTQTVDRGSDDAGKAPRQCT